MLKRKRQHHDRDPNSKKGGRYMIVAVDGLVHPGNLTWIETPIQEKGGETSQFKPLRQVLLKGQPCQGLLLEVEDGQVPFSWWSSSGWQDRNGGEVDETYLVYGADSSIALRAQFGSFGQAFAPLQGVLHSSGHLLMREEVVSRFRWHVSRSCARMAGEDTTEIRLHTWHVCHRNTFETSLETP